MRLAVLKYLSQKSIFIATNCSLYCLGCPFSKKSVQSKIEFISPDLNAEAHSFIQKLSKPTMVNVIGGDPILSKDSLSILRQLKSDGHYTRFWTTGIESELIYSQLLPFIDELFLFLPSGDSENYRELTGRDYLDLLMTRISFFKDQKVPLSINCPVLPINFPFLPELYDIIYEYKLPLLLHVPKSSELPKETMDWVYRFQKIESVTIIKTRLSHRSQSEISCPMVPYHPSLTNLQTAYLGLQEYYAKVRKKLSLTFFLKRHFG